MTLAIGDAQVSFTLSSKGSGGNRVSTFSKPTYNNKTGLWTFSATLKKGSWQTAWADYGMVNSPIRKPGSPVNLPVMLTLDVGTFMGSKNLHYTAMWDKPGRRSDGGQKTGDRSQETAHGLGRETADGYQRSAPKRIRGKPSAGQDRCRQVMSCSEVGVRVHCEQ